MIKTSLRVFVCLLVCVVPSAMGLSVSKIGDTVVDSQTLTLTNGTYGDAINGLSFQQDIVITHNGWQYVAYYDSDRCVSVARRQLPGGSWQKLQLTDYYFGSNDAHNVVVMGICPNDGTIHLSFDHHGSTLHYRVSQTGVATNPGSITWDASIFNGVRNELYGTNLYGVTYPRFWQTPDGDLQMSYRQGGSGDGDMILVNYDGTTQTWSKLRMVISGAGSYSDSLGSSSSRNPYMNGFHYGPNGRLHATWCWRESAGGANHDIMYAYSADGGLTWYNNNLPSVWGVSTGGASGQGLFTISWANEGLQVIGQATGQSSTEQLITLDSPDVTVVAMDRYYGLMNQQAQAVDSQGRIHVLMFHCTDETYDGYSWSTWGPIGARKYYHYWRDKQGVWHRNALAGVAGSRPKIYIAANGDAYVVYQSWRDPSLTSTAIYFNGDLTIQAATAASSWTDWQVIHVEQGLFLNEMLADPYRFDQEEILSVLVQEAPQWSGQATTMRILDFDLQ